MPALETLEESVPSLCIWSGRFYYVQNCAEGQQTWKRPAQFRVVIPSLLTRAFLIRKEDMS